MRSHQQIKVFSLTAEMTYIRRQELKWKKRAKLGRINASKYASVAHAEKAFWTLRGHRNELKIEARTTHLAYGALRGIPYSAMEIICYGVLKGYGSSEPRWADIEAMVERFTKDEDDTQGTMQKFAEWLADAKKWYEGNEDRIELLNRARPQRIAALKAKTAAHKAEKEVAAISASA